MLREIYEVFGSIKQSLIALLSFIGSISSLANGSYFAACTSLNNQPCMTRPILINLNPDKYNQGFHYYPFMINLDRCNGTCNNMIARINESRTLTKHISCKCNCKFDGRKFNSNQNWNEELCQCERKNSSKHHVCKKYYIWNPSACTCKNGKHLRSIIGDSVILYDEIIKVAKAVPTKTTA